VRFIYYGNEAVLQDLAPIAPSCVGVWNRCIPFYYELKNHVWLYVSKRGAVTPLHQDNNSVISYLAQYRGVKHATLFSPDASAYYYNQNVGYIDLAVSDRSEFPEFFKATAWTAVLKAGQLLIWGKNWAHYVETVEDSITASVDVVNVTNIRDYMNSMEWKKRLGYLLRKFPKVIEQYGERGVMLAEDLGDARLAEVVMKAKANEMFRVAKCETERVILEAILECL
jgi:hypothetical protein